MVGLEALASSVDAPGCGACIGFFGRGSRSQGDGRNPTRRPWLCVEAGASQGCPEEREQVVLEGQKHGAWGLGLWLMHIFRVARLSKWVGLGFLIKKVNIVSRGWFEMVGLTSGREPARLITDGPGSREGKLDSGTRRQQK